MNRYKNLGGTHVALDGTKYEHNDIIDTEEDLAAKFPGKFQPAPAALPVEEEETKETEEKPKAEKKAPKAKAKTKADRTDVTKEFANVVADELVVIKDSKGWWVYDADDLDEAINEKPLRKKEVADFCTEYLED